MFGMHFINKNHMYDINRRLVSTEPFNTGHHCQKNKKHNAPKQNSKHISFIIITSNQILTWFVFVVFKITQPYTIIHINCLSFQIHYRPVYCILHTVDDSNDTTCTTNVGQHRTGRRKASSSLLIHLV